jgi:hypothetical protein
VDHGLEAEVDLFGADDLCHILKKRLASIGIFMAPRYQTYTGVIGLQQGNLDAFVLEVALGLGQVQRGMVRGSVPELALTVKWKQGRKRKRAVRRRDEYPGPESAHTSWSRR